MPMVDFDRTGLLAMICLWRLVYVWLCSVY